MREGCLVQRAEKSETSSHDIQKTKDIMRKVEMIRRKKMFQQKVTPVIGMSNVFEAKLRLLRKNNRSLAKALSEQKMAANHWYTETITLRGELQEAHEKLLRMPYSNTNIEQVFVEAEKQIKECYKAIDKDFSMALERIVDAVEKLTKAKHLVGNTLNILQFPSQSPVNIFSRLSGSRTPLGTSGVGPPLQRAVLPMVSGHVLQPVMVPLPKLKITSSDRRNNCFLVNDENDPGISTIEEGSPTVNSDMSEEQLFQDDSEEHQPETNMESPTDNNILEAQSESGLDSVDLGVRLERVTGRSRTRSKAEASPNLQATTSFRRQGISRRGTGRRGGRKEDSRISKLSLYEDLPCLTGENEVLAPSPEEEDPLEGPSWLHATGNTRGALRGRYRGRRKRSSSRKDGKKTDDASTIDSSDQVEDTSIGISEMFRQTAAQEPSPRREAASTTTSPTETQSQSLDHSCLDSHASLLARLELLEAKGGRKSRRLLKSKLSTAALESELRDPASDIRTQENEQLVIGSPKKMVPVSSTKGPGVSLTVENKDGPCKNSPALISESIERQRPGDITCQLVTNMDITQPVSDIIIQQDIAPTVDDTEGSQDECKPTQSKKKFFKTKEQESIDEIPKVVERTPFDLSMLNETVVNMPPFSLMRTTEKENLQPLSSGGSDEAVTLCDVSVVLKDVIKESVSADAPRRSIRMTQKGSHSPKSTPLNFPERTRRARRMLQYSVNYNDDDEMRNDEWGGGKKQKNKKPQSPTAEGMPVKLKGLKKKSSKSLSNGLNDIHSNAEEAEVTNARVLSNKTDNMKILPNCYVRIQRSSIMETPSFRMDEDTSPEDLLIDLNALPDQQQLLSKSQIGRSTEMRGTPDANDDNADDCISSPVSRDRDTTHIEEYEKDNDIGNGIDESEIKFYSDDHIQQYEKESGDLKEIHEVEDAQQEHDYEEHSVPVSPPDSSTDAGCQKANEKTGTTSPKVSGSKMEDEGSTKSSTGLKTTLEKAEESHMKDNPRKRRAALKITSYKEDFLNVKMRRGENDSVTVSKSASRIRGRSRGRGRNKSRGTAEVIEII